jgi:adenylate kinase family enzyme
MRKILIIGSAGAGKSTLATALAERLELPVVHLDAHFWQPGWRETPREIWKDRVAELLRGDAWIMDGNYGGTLAQRVAAADTVILLVLPRITCLSRVIRRSFRHRGRARPDLNPGCPEQWPDWEFLRWIWRYPRASLPKVLDLLRAHEGNKTIIVLHSAQEVEQFLSSLTAREPSPAAR